MCLRVIPGSQEAGDGGANLMAMLYLCLYFYHLQHLLFMSSTMSRQIVCSALHWSHVLFIPTSKMRKLSLKEMRLPAGDRVCRARLSPPAQAAKALSLPRCEQAHDAQPGDVLSSC